MNSGTPASMALPDRSSRGMMRSTSTRTVSYSCAVKNFGMNGVAAGAASRRLRQAVRRRHLGVGPRESGGHRRRRQQPQHDWRRR